MTHSAVSPSRRKPHLVGDGGGWMVQLANTTFRGERGAAGLQWRRSVMLPAEKPSVNGPGARSDQRQGHGEHRPYGASPDMGPQREGDPRFGAPGNNSGDGRPQTGNEQDAGQRSDHFRGHSRPTGCRDCAVHQSTADQQSLDQKPGAWRTFRKRGEQPLHMDPDFRLRDSKQFRNTK